MEEDKVHYGIVKVKLVELVINVIQKYGKNHRIARATLRVFGLDLSIISSASSSNRGKRRRVIFLYQKYRGRCVAGSGSNTNRGSGSNLVDSLIIKLRLVALKGRATMATRIQSRARCAGNHARRDLARPFNLSVLIRVHKRRAFPSEREREPVSFRPYFVARYFFSVLTTKRGRILRQFKRASLEKG